MDDNNSKLWNKLDKLENSLEKLAELLNATSTMLARIGVRLDVKDRECQRQEACLARLKEKVEKLELNQAKVAGAAVAISIMANYILKGLGIQ